MKRGVLAAGIPLLGLIHTATAVGKHGLSGPEDVYRLLVALSALLIASAALAVRWYRPVEARSTLLVASLLGLWAVLWLLWIPGGFEPLLLSGLVLAALAWAIFEGLGLIKDVGAQVRELLAVFLETEAQRQARRDQLPTAGPIEADSFILAVWGVRRLLRWVEHQDGGIGLLSTIAQQQAAVYLTSEVLHALGRRKMLNALKAELSAEPAAGPYADRVNWRPFEARP